MKTKISLIILILSLILIPLVSALSANTFTSPFDIFENEWTMFGVIFLFAFAILYFSSLKTFSHNQGITAIISAGLSLVISLALTKKAMVSSITGEGIADWILIIGFMVLVLLLFKWLAFVKQPDGTKKLSKTRFIIVLFIILILFLYIDVYEHLPDSISYGPIGDLIEAIQGFSAVLISILISILIAIVVIYIIRRIIKKPKENP